MADDVLQYGSLFLNPNTVNEDIEQERMKLEEEHDCKISIFEREIVYHSGVRLTRITWMKGGVMETKGEKINRLATLVKRANEAHLAGQVAIAQTLIQQAKQLVREIDPDLSTTHH